MFPCVVLVSVGSGEQGSSNPSGDADPTHMTSRHPEAPLLRACSCEAKNARERSPAIFPKG